MVLDPPLSMFLVYPPFSPHERPLGDPVVVFALLALLRFVGHLDVVHVVHLEGLPHARNVPRALVVGRALGNHPVGEGHVDDLNPAGAHVLVDGARAGDGVDDQQLVAVLRDGGVLVVEALVPRLQPRQLHPVVAPVDGHRDGELVALVRVGVEGQHKRPPLHRPRQPQQVHLGVRVGQRGALRVAPALPPVHAGGPVHRLEAAAEQLHDALAPLPPRGRHRALDQPAAVGADLTLSLPRPAAVRGDQRAARRRGVALQLAVVEARGPAGALPPEGQGPRPVGALHHRGRVGDDLGNVALRLLAVEDHGLAPPHPV
mmetsp:Transcript_69499/g.219995  ORF Transcript_69499/g.219995 Transcript_69499/m.219995 type:complete len:316 (+) Transcript_69499:122-1069(+)